MELVISLDGYLVGEPPSTDEPLEELRLRIVPVLLGGGTPAFDDVAAVELSLESSRLLEDGTVELRYRRKGFVGREPV